MFLSGDLGNGPVDSAFPAQQQRGEFGDNPLPPAVVSDEAPPQCLAVMRLERPDDLPGLGFGLIEEIAFEALRRLEPFDERFERSDMLGIAGRARQRKEQGILSLVRGALTGAVTDHDLFAEGCSLMVDDCEQEQVAMPCIEMA